MKKPMPKTIVDALKREDLELKLCFDRTILCRHFHESKPYFHVIQSLMLTAAGDYENRVLYYGYTESKAVRALLTGKKQ